MYTVNITAQNSRDPTQWPQTKRYLIAILMAAMTFTVTMGASIISPAILNMEAYFDVRREVMVLSVSLYVLGLAMGSLFLGHISEYYGRSVVYRLTWMGFTITHIPVALSRNIEILLIFRFLGGLFGSPATTVVAGSLRDMWHDQNMDIPIALVLLSAFLGPVAGPVAGGYATQLGLGGESESWRWTIWILFITSSLLWIAVLFLPETLPQTSKSRRSSLDYIHGSLSPLRLLADPILLSLSIYLSLIYGLLFLYFGAYPRIFAAEYGWRQGPAGLSFLGIGAGVLLSLPTTVISRIYYPPPSWAVVPEHKLLLSTIAGVLAPGSVLWFSLSLKAHWLVPVASGVLFGWCMVTVFICNLGYLNILYKNDSTICMCSTSFVRYLFAFAFPLFTTPIYDKLGAELAGTLIACLLVAFYPLNVVFFFWGARIRSRIARHRE